MEKEGAAGAMGFGVSKEKMGKEANNTEKKETSKNFFEDFIAITQFIDFFEE
jgi:hypothetical protein